MRTFTERMILLLSCMCIAAIVFFATRTGERWHDTAGAERIFGLQFTDAERDSMQQSLLDQRGNYERIRALHLPNSVSPAFRFDPVVSGQSEMPQRTSAFRLPATPAVKRPAALEEVAFWSVRELGELIRTRQVSSVEMTQMYLGRLKTYGPRLECVVTLMEESAMRQARRADEEIARGQYRGPLHGIPYGAKDLLSTKNAKTTWGSVPYKDQMLDEDATVIRKLEDAGAVLVAKLTLGELAWGDVWFGGMTRNPWNYDEGSSGSSAGSASATAAGLVGFAIGSETWGSIVSPSTRCGTTGLRPTFGRVSRHGAMALSWTMDKLGPICRTAEDCAIVFRAIAGPDGKDRTVVDAPFAYDGTVDIRGLRIGYIKSAFENLTGEERVAADSALSIIRAMGISPIAVELPNRYPVSDLAFILSAEAAAAFDDLTLSGKDDLLVRQIKDAWPNVLRAARFIPAVEYIQANRVRSLVMQEMERMMETVDVYLVPPFEGDNLLLTNLTGHPCVVLPSGFTSRGTPMSLSFVGRLYDEASVLAVANAFQRNSGFHLRHPALRP